MKTQELKVVGALLEDPTAWHYSLGIGALAGIPAGTIYPLLANLEKSGWLESRWDNSKVQGVRRRLYRLTGVGQRSATLELSQVSSGSGRARQRFRFGLPRAGVGFR